MRISSLKIENFKAITNLEILNFPNLIGIVGENGIGKTSIFDAIGFLKSLVGPYHPQDRNWWESRFRQHSPIRVGSDHLTIEIDFEPTTPNERTLTGNNTENAKVEIKSSNPNNALVSATHNAQGLLSSWRKTPGIGAIEIIPANRTFQEGEIQLQSVSSDNEQIFYERTSQIQNKYHNAKASFVNCFVHDKLREQDAPLFPEIKSLVETLLGKMVRINPDERLVPKIEFESSSGGWVNIDTLSSGQREMFMTYVGIHSTKLSNSIILFDEPDLHLHASLQKEVLRYLLNLSKTGIQIFFTTHALEMISETLEENLFHLTPYTSGSQLHSLTDEREKVEIFASLGASKYTFVNFKKVVFVEGPTDELILQHAAPSKYGLRFEYVGGISKLSPSLLDNASKIESFFMIRDRDFLNDSTIIAEENKYNKKVRYLKRRHIENYILDSNELFEIYQKHGDGTISNKQEFVSKLFLISQNQMEQTIADYFLFKHTENTNPPEIHVKQSETADVAIKDALSKKMTRLNTSISNVDVELQQTRKDLLSRWTSEWLILCSGKNVLSAAADRYFKNKSMGDIRDLVSSKWDESKQLPPELDAILQQITSG